MNTVTSLKKVTKNVRSLVESALEDGGGLLRLAPCWVPRSFLQPGKRLKLHPDDLYAFGLNRGGIDRSAHEAPQRIDLANEMSLRSTANRWIARHVADRVGRERAESDVRAKASGRIRGLAARVSSADNDDVEFHLPYFIGSIFICQRRSARRYAPGDPPARDGR